MRCLMRDGDAVTGRPTVAGLPGGSGAGPASNRVLSARGEAQDGQEARLRPFPLPLRHRGVGSG